jgi:AsmA protein
LHDIALRIVPVSGLPTTEPLSAGGALALDVGKLTLSDMKIRLESAGTRIRADGQAALANGSGALTFSLESAPRRIMQALGMTVPLADGGALQSVQASGKLEFGGSRFILNRLDGKLDDTTFNGEITLTAAPDVAAAGKLHFGALRLDRYLPVSAGKAQNAPDPAGRETAGAAKDPAPAGRATAKTPDKAGQAAGARSAHPGLDLALEMEQMQVRGLRVENIRATLKGKNGQYRLEPCAFRLYDSNVSVRGGVNLLRQEYALNLAADKLDIGALLREQAGVKDVAGRVNVRADVSAAGQTEAAIRRSLNGTLRLIGQANLDTGLVPKEWEALHALIGREVGTITLNALDVTAKAAGGIVDVEPVKLDGPVVRGNGKGVVDLPADTINGRFTARIGKTDLPLWIEGPLGSPRYGLDATSVIKDRLLDQPAVKKQIRRGTKEVERGVERLLKKLR